jgi:hypothetical protein
MASNADLSQIRQSLFRLVALDLMISHREIMSVDSSDL